MIGTKTGQSGLLYGSKSPAEISGRDGIFKPAEPQSPGDACC